MYEIRKMMKNYKTLTNRKYRIATNIVIPVASAVIICLLAGVSENLYGLALLILSFVQMAEIMGDYFGFGSFCKKNSFGMYFLKSSYDGIHCFEDALLLDILVRPFRIAVFFMIAGLPFIGTLMDGWMLFSIIACFSAFSIASLNVTRYIDMAQCVVLVSGIFLALMAGSVAVLFLCRIPAGAMAAMMAALLLLTIVLTYFHMLVRIRKSYLDI